MELTQKDYEERINRRAAGQQTDEDLRLIKQYEANGFSTDDDSAGKRADSHTAETPDAGQTAHATQPGEVKPTKRAAGRAGNSGS